MSKITIRDIKARYLTSKQDEKKFKWTYHVRRPVSYYLAWSFLKLGISATTVTILSLVVAIAGCILMASGGYVQMVTGAALLELAVILDCVDGHIARFTRSTRIGQVMDMWVGQTLVISSLFSIGIGLYNSPDQVLVGELVTALNMDKVVFLYLGFLTALASLSSWAVRLHWRTITMKLSLKDGEPDRDLRDLKGVRILDNLFHYSGALTMLMVVSAILNSLDLLLILLSTIIGIYLIGVLYRIVKKAGSLESDNLDESQRYANSKE